LNQRIPELLPGRTDKNFQELVVNTLYFICNVEIADKEPSAREELREYLDKFGEV